MEQTPNQKANIDYAKKWTDINELVLKERYRVLSELWNEKSKHATHIKIGKMMDDTLEKLKRIEDIRGVVSETEGKIKAK